MAGMCLCLTRLLFSPQVWLHAPYELHLSLFEHFIELLTESRQVPKLFLFVTYISAQKRTSAVTVFTTFSI